MIGIYRRLGRMFDAVSGRTLILPLDHGVGEGMLPGMEAVGKLVEMARDKNVQAVVLNKGPAKAHGPAVPLETCVVVQLSGGTKHALPPYGRGIVCSITEALRLGADAVCMQINIGNDLEDRMLGDFGAMADEAHQLGLPVLAFIAPRGGHIVNEHDPILISHCIRLGSELGADITCVPYSGDPDSFTAAITGSDVPVVVTGGPGKGDFAGFLKSMDEALACGAAGLCIGRNIFQSQDPAAALDRIVSLVHDVEPQAQDAAPDSTPDGDRPDAPAPDGPAPLADKAK